MNPVEALERLAEVNPRVVSRLELEHGRIIARVAYEQAPVVVTETITLAQGLGVRPDETSGSPRELARRAVAAAAVDRWQVGAAGGRVLEVGAEPTIMGVLNVTPDSFSDGGLHEDPAAAVDRGLAMLAEGAHWVDVGGESTRPGAAVVPLSEEIARVVPVIEGLTRQADAPVSIDTSKAEVARAALGAGASIINDVTALSGDPRMVGVAVKSGATVVLMHMLGTPRTMQDAPAYGDVVADVARFLRQALARAAAAGIDPERTILDPGIGFGKTLDHNLALIARLEELRSLGRPLLVGASRKSFLGQLLDLPVDDRAVASAQVHALAVDRGAAIIRAHDIAETGRAVRLVRAVR